MRPLNLAFSCIISPSIPEEIPSVTVDFTRDYRSIDKKIDIKAFLACPWHYKNIAARKANFIFGYEKVLDISIKMALSNVRTVLKEGYRIMARDVKLFKLAEEVDSQFKTWHLFCYLRPVLYGSILCAFPIEST